MAQSTERKQEIVAAAAELVNVFGNVAMENVADDITSMDQMGHMPTTGNHFFVITLPNGLQARVTVDVVDLNY